MSITVTTTKRESTTPTTIKRESASLTTLSLSISSSTTPGRSSTIVQLDTATPIPSATTDVSSNDVPSATTSSTEPSTTCSTNSDCASDTACSRGTCTSLIEAAPFGPGDNSSLNSTTRLSTGAAIGIGIGLMAFIMLLVGFGFWFWRIRGRRPPNGSIEAPPNNRNRSASSSTDPKTLVASVPNSPQNAGFRAQHDEMAPEIFAKLPEANGDPDYETEKAMLTQESSDSARDQRSTSTEKALPLPPTNMPLPLRPTEETRYAINVNINKSMIFDDIMLATSPARDGDVSRDRMPRYRFEEYLPPVIMTPRLSISHDSTSRRASDYELEPYPRSDDVSDADATTDDGEEAEVRSRRRKTLKKLESKPPQLPAPELPPPSPSFSFRSYDWYQDIIGPEQSSAEQSNAEDSTPAIPIRNSARTPTQATFSATLSLNHLDVAPSLLPQPLSPSVPPPPVKSSHLDPSFSPLPSSATTSSFQLSPSVYIMPSQPLRAQPPRAEPPRAQPPRTSLQSTLTEKTHTSRSWLPDDGLYLPEEGTHDSYMMFKQKRVSDSSRPTSYSPLS